MRSFFRMGKGFLLLSFIILKLDTLFALDCREVFVGKNQDSNELGYTVEVFHTRTPMSKAMFSSAFLYLKPLVQETKDLLVATKENGSSSVSWFESEKLKVEDQISKKEVRILLIDLIYSYLDQAKKNYHYHSITVPYWYQTHHPELRTIRLMVKILSSDQFISFCSSKDKKYMKDPFVEIESLRGIDDMLYEMSLFFFKEKASELDKIQFKYGVSKIELLDIIESLFKSLILSLGKKLYTTGTEFPVESFSSSFMVEDLKSLGSAVIVSSNTIKIQTKLLKALRKEGGAEFAGEIYIIKIDGDKKTLIPAINSYGFSYFTLRGKTPFTLIRFPHGTFQNTSNYQDNSEIFNSEVEIKALIKMIKKDGMLMINGINDMPASSFGD